MKLEFKRVVRDCPSNDTVKSLGTGVLIYDFNVLIDGEHRATFKRGYRRGYELVWALEGYHYTVAREYDKGTWVQRVNVDHVNQPQFDVMIKACLDENLIPTVKQLADFVKAKEQEEKDKDFEERVNARKGRLHACSDEMWRLLEDIFMNGLTRAHETSIQKLRKSIGPVEKR